MPEGFTPDLVEELLRRALGQRADQLLRERMLRTLLETAVAGAERVAGEMSLPDALGPTHPTLRRLATNHLPKLLQINETTRERLRNGLLTAIADGRNLPEQLDVIRETFQAAGRQRAMTIARTENAIFWNGGSHAQAVEGGAVGHLWVTSRDLRVRESHIPMDGQCKPIAEAFVSGAGARLLHPGDPNGPVGEIVNCRCTSAPLTRGCDSRALLFGSEARRAWYWRGVIKSQTSRERVVLRTIRGIFQVQRQAVTGIAEELVA